MGFKRGMKTYLLICLISFQLSSYPSGIFRRVKDISVPNLTEAEERVEKIWVEVLGQANKDLGATLPRSILNACAKLIELDIPGAEEFIAHSFKIMIDMDPSTDLKPLELDENLLREVYEDVKQLYYSKLNFSGNEFMSFEELKGRIYRTSFEGGICVRGFGFILIGEKILEEAGRSPDVFKYLLCHELIHLISRGFEILELEEGLAHYLTKEVYDVKGPRRITIEQLIKIVGEQPLLRAYMLGSFEPLRPYLGDEVIEVLEVYDALHFVSRFSERGRLSLMELNLRVNLFESRESVLSWILANRDDADNLSKIKELLLDYLKEAVKF